MNQSGWLSDIIFLWRYLGRSYKRHFFLLFTLMLMSVVAEVVSIGAVIPFLAAMTDPDALFRAAWAQPVIVFFGTQTADDLLLPMTLAFVSAAVCAAAMRISLLWFNTRLSAKMGVKLRGDVYSITLSQPYEFHVAHNSSELISLTSGKVATAIAIGILQVLTLGTALVMSCGIISTLFYVNTLITLSALVVIGSGYLLIGFLVRRRIKKNGLIIASKSPEAIKCVQEGIGGIRDVIIDNSQPEFSRNFAKTVKSIQYASAENGFLGALPKSLLEVIGITLIAFLAYSLTSNLDAQQNVFPMLGAFVLGAQRLLPNLQQIYSSWVNISGGHASLFDVVAALHQADAVPNSLQKPINSLGFNNNVVLQDVNFKYAGSDEDILTNILLTIPKGTKTGFIGATGSGKSTLLDIVMGLLSPSQGQILVDGVAIDKDNVRAWQGNIAHVSQSIFLSDASMAENVAFGVPRDKVNLEQVKRAAKLAQIDAFIETLPQGYQTLVGERGVRLSGGQRQRIGIARSLYKKANVLILDEATSALDGETEQEVMSAINALDDSLTILIIAHRLSTLDGCDRVIELAKGEIVRQGSYEEMTSPNIS